MAAAKQVTIQSLHEMKAAGSKITMLTAYDYYTAKILDEAGVEMLLVGDTVGMALGGHPTTIPVKLDHIVYHAEMVSRGARRAMVIGDLPFLTYQVTIENAVYNAGRLMQEGKVHAVKLEGGRSMIPFIKHILGAGIPVMGHLGLTPQSATMLGGYRAQARTAAAARRLVDDAIALEEAGVFSIVLEAVPAVVAERATRAVSVPTIGIGAGPGCTGQVLVWHDLLGLTDGHVPKFVRAYANLSAEILRALEAYVADVHSGAFPDERHTYAMPEDQQVLFEADLAGSGK